MSYGMNFTEMYRRSANLVDKILRGGKPSDIPIERPTTFEFIVNQKTAQAIGVSVPRQVLLRVDRVIE